MIWQHTLANGDNVAHAHHLDDDGRPYRRATCSSMWLSQVHPDLAASR